MMTDYPNISARAMLVSLRISTWTARRFDRSATAQVNEGHRATHDAGRYNKHILAGADEHRSVLARVSSARLMHYAQTLPWSDDGWRLLPTANYMHYRDAMSKERASFDASLREFLEQYPRLSEEAEVKLGTLYRAEDYPSATDVRSRFSWAIEFSPVPDHGDLRVSLPTDTLSAIEADITSRVERATRDAMTDAWRRLYDVVCHIRDRLSDPEAIFRDSLIGNSREICDVLSRLNIAGDDRLESMRRRVEQQLSTVAPEELRKDQSLRADVVQKADDIMRAMGAFYAPDKATAA